MPQKSETRAVEARASRNCLGGWFRDSLTVSLFAPQPLPELIALHIGAPFVARWAAGGGHG